VISHVSAVFDCAGLLARQLPGCVEGCGRLNEPVDGAPQENVRGTVVFIVGNVIAQRVGGAAKLLGFEFAEGFFIELAEQPAALVGLRPCACTLGESVDGVKCVQRASEIIQELIRKS
jgi:hypothetical protein